MRLGTLDDSRCFLLGGNGRDEQRNENDLHRRNMCNVLTLANRKRPEEATCLPTVVLLVLFVFQVRAELCCVGPLECECALCC